MQIDYDTLHELTEHDLTSLVTSGTQEGEQLDFKLAEYSGAEGRRSLCKDLSAMANTRGGCILLGVEENTETGAAIAIPGLSTNIDSFLNWVQQVTEAGIRPRIPLRQKSVRLLNGAHVVALATPRTRTGPHIVTAENEWRFFKRANRVVERMDSDDVRRIAMSSHSEIDVVMQQHRERRYSYGTPQSNCFTLVLDYVPLPNISDRIQIRDYPVQYKIRELTPFINSGFDYRVTFDGYLLVRRPVDSEDCALDFLVTDSASVHGSFTNGMFRNRGNPLFAATRFFVHLHDTLESIHKFYKEHRINDPACLAVSLIGLKDHVLGWEEGADGYPCDRDILEFPPIPADHLHRTTAQILQPVMHRLFNAFGIARCSLYDVNGQANQDLLRKILR